MGLKPYPCFFPQASAGNLEATARAAPKPPGKARSSLCSSSCAAAELGHVFAARYYDVPTSDVTLWPFGGADARQASQELVVALAGPAANVVIAAGLLLWFGPRLDPANLTQIENPAVSMAAKVAGANIILVLFNMIPAFPWMAGGCCAPYSPCGWEMRAPPSLPPPSTRASPWSGILGIFYNPMSFKNFWKSL